jgi:tRNA (cytidine/uridine-2'-O-)-methyltransferase
VRSADGGLTDYIHSLFDCGGAGQYSVHMTTPLHLVLVKPQIPHNTGAIGRLCVGLDCMLHLIRPLGFHLSDAYIRRAGLDYWQHLRLAVYDSWPAFLAAVQPPRLFFLSTHGTRTLFDCSFQPYDALVFGNEGAGLPPHFYNEYRDHLVTLPMPGPHARSINLANAAAAAAYEFYRQVGLPR